MGLQHSASSEQCGTNDGATIKRSLVLIALRSSGSRNHPFTSLANCIRSAERVIRFSHTDSRSVSHDGEYSHTADAHNDLCCSASFALTKDDRPTRHDEVACFNYGSTRRLLLLSLSRLHMVVR